MTRTYTLTKTEQDLAARLTTRSADTQGLPEVLGEGFPVQPISVDLVPDGWAGAEWVRAVAHYQDSPSVGYASLEDLEIDHQWTSDVVVEWQDGAATRLADAAEEALVTTLVSAVGDRWNDGTGTIYTVVRWAIADGTVSDASPESVAAIVEISREAEIEAAAERADR